MKTLSFNLVLSLLVILLLAGCSPREKITIGISLGPVGERWTKDINYLSQQLESQGVEVIVQQANNDQVEQNRQVLDLVDEEAPDVLIIIPVNSKEAGAVVDYAKKKNVKVIAYDRIIENCELDCYLSFDNVRIGEMQAEYLSKIRSSGRYVILGGDPGDNNSLYLRMGQMNILQPLITKGDVKVVLDKNVESWLADNAYQIMKEYLEQDTLLDAIVASNDKIANGAIRALDEHGLAGKVLVSGQDAETEACRRIVDGAQTMTVYKVIESLAASTANIAISLARNEPVPNSLTTINNGKKMVPSILLSSLIPVGEGNIRATVIADGFIDEKQVFGEE
jgi:D-xylose ABC transporter substrate-binding protein